MRVKYVAYVYDIPLAEKLYSQLDVCNMHSMLFRSCMYVQGECTLEILKKVLIDNVSACYVTLESICV